MKGSPIMYHNRARCKSMFALSLFFFCESCTPHPKTVEFPTTAPSTQTQATQSPNRFDTSAWPEITSEDRFFLAQRLAPAFLESTEAHGIQLQIQTTPTLVTENWLLPIREALQVDVQPLSEIFSIPGDFLWQGETLTLTLRDNAGKEWVSYLLCRAILLHDKTLRETLLGEQQQHWSLGEEELCLWSMLGTLEHQQLGVAAPVPSELTREIERAAKKNLLRGFVLARLVVPLRGSRDGLATTDAELLTRYLADVEREKQK